MIEYNCTVLDTIVEKATRNLGKKELRKMKMKVQLKVTSS